MCNLIRYKEEIQTVYGTFAELGQVRIVPKLRYRVAPSEPAPVITVRNETPQIDMMHFGLKTAKGGRQLMARGETVARLPMFRDAFKYQRCLIISHGFYDSLDMGFYRQPWHVHLKDDGLMCFAGLWQPAGESGNFTIVSAPANSVVARVIDRMPVILPPDAWKTWLNPGTKADHLQSLLKPFPSESMEAYPVTREVNKKGFESPRCIQRVIPDQGELDMF